MKSAAALLVLLLAGCVSPDMSGKKLSERVPIFVDISLDRKAVVQFLDLSERYYRGWQGESPKELKGICVYAGETPYVGRHPGGKLAYYSHKTQFVHISQDGLFAAVHEFHHANGNLKHDRSFVKANRLGKRIWSQFNNDH